MRFISTDTLVFYYLIHKDLLTDENLYGRSFQFPSQCNLCQTHAETADHVFFYCEYVTSIWNWFSNILALPYIISCHLDCWKTIDRMWYPQGQAVITTGVWCIISKIPMARKHVQIWAYQHSLKKSALSQLSHLWERIVGNNYNKVAGSSITEFSILKSFSINIHPLKSRRSIDVLWKPPLQVGSNVT